MLCVRRHGRKKNKIHRYIFIGTKSRRRAAAPSRHCTRFWIDFFPLACPSISLSHAGSHGDGRPPNSSQGGASQGSLGTRLQDDPSAADLHSLLCSLHSSELVLACCECCSTSANLCIDMCGAPPVPSSSILPPPPPLPTRC
jgi:hypothetical protein